MGLFSKNNGYVKMRNSHGDVVYAQPASDKVVAKYATVGDVKKDANALKRDLQTLNNRIKDANRGMVSSNRGADSKGAAKARVDDTKEMLKRRDQLIKQLGSLGVHVIPQSLYGSSIQYRESAEEGGNTMQYTDKEINKMRLDVHEAARSGEISNELRDYLLLTIESTVEDYNNKVLSDNLQAVWTEEAKENYAKAKLYLYESHEAGAINKDQLVTMLESLGEESDYVAKEVADKKAESEAPEEAEISDEVAKEHAEELLSDLALLYIEACKEGNCDAKEKIKEKMEAIKAKKDGVVAAGKEKLSSVKKKLKEAGAKLSAKDKEKLEIMKKRVSGGKADIEDLKDEEPMIAEESTKAEEVVVEFVGGVSNQSLDEFSKEVLTTEAYANLTDDEKVRMNNFFESYLTEFKSDITRYNEARLADQRGKSVLGHVLSKDGKQQMKERDFITKRGTGFINNDGSVTEHKYDKKSLTAKTVRQNAMRNAAEVAQSRENSKDIAEMRDSVKKLPKEHQSVKDEYSTITKPAAKEAANALGLDTKK